MNTVDVFGTFSKVFPEAFTNPRGAYPHLRSFRKAVKRTGQRQKKKPTAPAIVMLPISEVIPSPENDKLYRRFDPSNEADQLFADDVAVRGVIDALVLSSDYYILSGHRRYYAARLKGLVSVPCIIRQDVSHDDDPERFTELLAAYNQQREKTAAEKVHEAVALANPEEAHRVLVEHRRQKSDLSNFADNALQLSAYSGRKNITDAKAPMLAAVRQIIDENQKFGHLSVRQIHYRLLTMNVRKHASKRRSIYRNDRKSYQDLCDLLTRARLCGRISWNAIADETRPTNLNSFHHNTGAYLRTEIDGLLKGYYRNLQQSQPNHIELVAEKLTVRGIIDPLASQFCIPVTYGRGYCSITPRYEMAQRFRRSGREKLIVLLLSDFDPDGESIAESFARSMRDDFGIENILPVKVALTAKQIKAHRLPPTMEAKKSSAQYNKFANAHGTLAYELEALPAETLQNIVRDAIDSVIDIAAFNAEVDAEAIDAAKLDGIRGVVLKTLEGIDLEGGAS